MKPPICCICDKRLDYPDEGGLIYFKKRPSDKKWDKKMEKEGMVGHPPYAEWFCGDHYEKASELKELPIDKALKMITKPSINNQKKDPLKHFGIANNLSDEILDEFEISVKEGKKTMKFNNP